MINFKRDENKIKKDGYLDSLNRARRRRRGNQELKKYLLIAGAALLLIAILAAAVFAVRGRTAGSAA